MKTVTSKPTTRIPMVDLQAQYLRYQPEIDEAVGRTISSANFILGEEVGSFERELAQYCGCTDAIGCASGTDALILALLALGVGAGDEVIVPAFTFIATAEAVARVGAVPVFADITAEDFTIDPMSVLQRLSFRTKGVIAVSLFGQCADMDTLQRACDSCGIFLLEDAAQSFGSSIRERRSGSVSRIAATSFYPSKPLGGYGDGGAVFTNDGSFAAKIRSLRNHGQAAPYEHEYVGLNSRLDALQAAILRVKLRHLDEEISARRRVAELYTKRLRGLVGLPVERTGNRSVWAQYTIRIPSPNGERDEVVKRMLLRDVSTAIYYPTPLHRQRAFTSSPAPATGRAAEPAAFDCPVSDAASREVLSLPIHAFLDDATVGYICDSLEEAL